ncbi:hypothetical protein BDV98DRAFT_113626 [Pterulicium gracile]|uniref:Uncharacterized protein n=1 Tax=Pterulicium gracile TaxID=1884261 RepID=A0A5C3QPW1_9AGAR|nr:hypothetical protein BDV98DRAFT_113626 [Pterula gracilis]
MPEYEEGPALRRFYSRKASFDAAYNARARRRGEPGSLPETPSTSSPDSETFLIPSFSAGSVKKKRKKSHLPIGVVDPRTTRSHGSIEEQRSHTASISSRPNSLDRHPRVVSGLEGSLTLNRRSKTESGQLDLPSVSSIKPRVNPKYSVLSAGEQALRRRRKTPRSRLPPSIDTSTRPPSPKPTSQPIRVPRRPKRPPQSLDLHLLNPGQLVLPSALTSRFSMSTPFQVQTNFTQRSPEADKGGQGSPVDHLSPQADGFLCCLPPVKSSRGRFQRYAASIRSRASRLYTGISCTPTRSRSTRSKSSASRPSSSHTEKPSPPPT